MHDSIVQKLIKETIKQTEKVRKSSWLQKLL